MNVVYLILAHDQPQQLARLLAALRDEGVQFFVHIDANASMLPFRACEAPDVHFCRRRIRCAWGNISLVDATFVLMREALAASRPGDRFVLLSGACYPIQPTAYRSTFFSAHLTTEFVECFPFPNEAFGKPIERVSRYWIKRNRPLLRLKWIVQKALLRYGPERDYRRALGTDLDLAVGSQWWALTREAVAYVLRFVESRPSFAAFCRHVDCPDEFLIQTILFNSPFKCRISHTLTYTRWTPGKTGPDFVDARMLGRFRTDPVMADVDNNCPQEKRETIFARKVLPSSAESAAIEEIVEEKRCRLEGRRSK